MPDNLCVCQFTHDLYILEEETHLRYEGN